jgi:hypothetical protein
VGESKGTFIAHGLVFRCSRPGLFISQVRASQPSVHTSSLSVLLFPFFLRQVYMSSFVGCGVRCICCHPLSFLYHMSGFCRRVLSWPCGVRLFSRTSGSMVLSDPLLPPLLARAHPWRRFLACLSYGRFRPSGSPFGYISSCTVLSVLGWFRNVWGIFGSAPEVTSLGSCVFRPARTRCQSILCPCVRMSCVPELSVQAAVLRVITCPKVCHASSMSH